MSETRRRALLFAGFFLFFSGLYALTLPRHYSYDGLCYALDVERATFGNLFHPNHLLYSFTQKQIWLVTQKLGAALPAIYLMQSVNALVAAAAVASLALVLYLSSGYFVALSLAALFGLSFAFWSEAADPGCYAFTALAAVAYAECLRRDWPPRAWQKGVLYGFFVLWHQIFVLLLPAALWRRTWREGGGFFAAFLPVVGIPYLWAAFSFHGPRWQDALFWAVGPAGPPSGVKILSSFWWSVDILRNIQVWFESFAQAWLLGPAFSGPVCILAGFVLLVVSVYALRQVRPLNRRLLIAVITLSVFLFFFYIGALRYRIVLFAFLLPLLAPALSRIPSSFSRSLLLAAVLAIGTANALGPVLQRHSLPEQALRMNWLKSVLQKQDFLIFRGEGSDSIENVYLGYFAPYAPAQSLKGYFFKYPDQNPEALLRQLNDLKTQGWRIWVEKPLLAFFTGWRAHGELAGPNGYTLVQITPERQAK